MPEYTDEDDARIEAAVTALFREVRELGGSVEGLAMAALQNVGVTVEDEKYGWVVTERAPVDHEELARMWIYSNGFAYLDNMGEKIRTFFERPDLRDADIDMIVDLIKSATYNLKTTSRTFP